jgi:hypothetical protein
LPILSIITQADYVRELLEQELKKRQFFVLDVNGGYYDNPLLAGAPFRDNWPTANKELVEAGNCFAVDRYTACVCHLMRALEYALKAFENELKITAPARGPENTWGKIIGRIEQKKKQPSPEWMAKAGFNDNCLTFFCAVKSACRDKTFHVESSYDKGSASSLFSCTVAVLSEISKELKEI